MFESRRAEQAIGRREVKRRCNVVECAEALVAYFGPAQATAIAV